MPTPRKKERITGTYFIWLLGQRNGVFTADGRANKPDAGRHSLATKDYKQALENLKKLDLVQAVELGLADRSALAVTTANTLNLAEGRRLYEEYVKRPRIVGGAKPISVKRYRSVFDKFEQFAQREGITIWNQVTHRTLEAYAAHLEASGYAPRSQYLELTCVKQLIKWLAREGHLPASCQIRLPVAKPEGCSVYCWRPLEVQAMTQHCRQHAELHWLGDVLVSLACTGLRISELASLRWVDVDWENNLIRLTDESSLPKRKQNRKIRETKSGRSRSFPIHDDLRHVLEKIPRSSDGLVFFGPNGGRLKADTVRRALVRDVITPLAEKFPSPEGEIGFKDGRLHSFRHFFTSVCANQGVPEQVVKEWLGHTDSRITRHYYTLHNEEGQRQMRRIYFRGDAGGAVAAGPV